MSNRQVRFNCLELVAQNFEITPSEVIPFARQIEDFINELPAETAADLAGAPGTPPARSASATKEDKYTIYHPNGEKRAGYMHSKDALHVLQIELADVTTVSQLEGYQQYNIPAMSKLAKDDINKLQLSIAEKVQELRKAQENPTPAADANSDTLPSGEETAKAADTATGTGSNGQTAPTVASPSDADLAALFSATPADPIVVAAAENALTKDVYVREMMKIAKALGAQESGAWLLKEGYDNILKVPAEAYRSLVEKGQARIAELKGA